MVIFALRLGLKKYAPKTFENVGKCSRKTKDVFQLVKSSNALDVLTTRSASSAWKLRSSARNQLDGRGTAIAIHDSGVDCQYPTLKDKCILTVNCISSPVDSAVHGTLCATIAIKLSHKPNNFCP